MFQVGAVRWTGAGCLVFPLLLAGLVFGAVVQEVFDGKSLITDAGWAMGFVLSAVLIRLIGTRLNRYRDEHTLYDSPMQSYVWLAATCAVLALGVVILARVVADSS
ncbi:hypothetical protein SAMN05216266_101697 [Amycolatopsis marina]|uniref:Uncharacterized protein n=1 Tax=Amycolatopsis marina TaxID=490629 RepID=A0A1I0W367_9PSEU|nr:hypothetical protein [Amycolatopsis marina]SFA83004.1 hypothetical protein SAMN05216266_101697 [Amycolatopsis marina]